LLETWAFNLLQTSLYSANAAREEESYDMGLSKKFFFLFIMDRHMEPLGGGARSTKSEEVPQFLVFAWSSVEV